VSLLSTGLIAKKNGSLSLSLPLSLGLVELQESSRWNLFRREIDYSRDLRALFGHISGASRFHRLADSHGEDLKVGPAGLGLEQIESIMLARTIARPCRDACFSSDGLGKLALPLRTAAKKPGRISAIRLAESKGANAVAPALRRTFSVSLSVLDRHSIGLLARRYS
jgi:hypothetical protein